MNKNSKNASENSQTIESYNVVAMNGKVTDLTFYDTKLISHTKAIEQFRNAGNIAIIAIANELAKMDNDESYKAGGFKSIADYGRIVFDYKPSTVSLYVRCANAFIADVTETGIVYADKLPTLTMGQMIELLPLYNDAGIESVVNVFASGEANNRMSTKTLRDVVSRARAITTRGEEVDSDNTKSSEVSPMEKAVKLSNKKVEHNKAYFSTIIAGIGDMLNMLNDDLLEQGYSFTEIGNVQVSIEELEKAISTIAD